MSLNINETSSRGQAGSLLGDAGRKDEVKRLAQGVAAEHFRAGQAQQFQNGNSAYQDSSRLSDEALEEISGSGKAAEIQRTDQLVSALREAFDAKAPQQQPQGQAEGQNDPAAADGAEPGKKLQKKRTVHWEPSIEQGQIHPEGREVIGKITIKEDVKEIDAPGGAAKNSSGSSSGGGAQSSSPGSGNSSAVPSTVGGVGKGQSSGNSAAQGNQESQKKMDQEGEADKGMASAAANMKSAGVQPTPEMEQGAGNYEKGEKTKEFDARTSATGATQTVSVTPAGPLEGAETLRYFKKLDDKPVLKAVSLHSRGESLDRTANRYAQEALAQGESPDQVVQGVEQLKKATPDQ
jgi:hypothetical protein